MDEPTSQMPPAPGPPGAAGEPPRPEEPSDRKTVLLVVAIAVIILLVGAGIAAFVWQKRTAEEARERAAAAEEALDELREQIPADEEAPDEADTETVEETDDADATDASGDEDGDETDETADGGVEDGRFIGYVTDIYNVGATRYVEMDYVQFLTGEEAEEAATARGDEVLDFYILNENPRLRDIPVEPGLEITMWTWNMPSEGVGEQDVLFDVWWDEIVMHGVERYMDVPYWVEIEDGVIVEMEEQYLP